MRDIPQPILAHALARRQTRRAAAERRLRARREWGRAGREPTLASLLDDPAILLLMQADGLSREAVQDHVRDCARRLRERNGR
jgi:hypothetical protein